MRRTSMRKQRGEAWLMMLCIFGPLSFAIMTVGVSWQGAQKAKFQHEKEMAMLQKGCPVVAPTVVAPPRERGTISISLGSKGS